MAAEWRKIRGILDELLNNSFQAGATVVESRIIDDGDAFTIIVKDNGRGMSEQVREMAEEMLGQDRRRELEEYYGHLAGKTAKSSGLTIVGMMVDEYTLETEKGVGTEITVRIIKD